MSQTSKAEDIVSRIELAEDITFENPAKVKQIIEEELESYEDEILDDLDDEEDEEWW